MNLDRQAAERLFQVVFEDVRHGDEVYVLVAGEQVTPPASASAAAHQAGLQSVAARRVRAAVGAERMRTRQRPRGSTSRAGFYGKCHPGFA